MKVNTSPETAHVDQAGEGALPATPVEGEFRERFERKFFIQARHIGFALALLRQGCRRDARYPREQIHSLYFDTLDLEQFERSHAGDFRKDKVRIRWYSDGTELPRTIPVFLELKSRRGFASSKRRERYLVASESLAPRALGAGVVDKTTFLKVLSRFGYLPAGHLRPVVFVSYSRHRFTELLTGVRVCLDRDIRSTLVARELGYGERNLRLQGAVIEVKGRGMLLPKTLKRLEWLDADWTRFSKYGACIDAHLENMGSVGRSWPSGRTGLA